MATAAVPRKGAVSQESTYLWTGKDKAGKTIRGEIRANGEAQVNATLRRQGIKIDSVKKQRLRTGGDWQKYDLVFCNAIGDPLSENAIRIKFQAVLEAAGLPHFRVYDLRHSTATLLMSQGTSPKIVSERLGHANVKITLGV